jgi:decaprenylphospho-beta-D-erythro-pentofuranosid-2-ulose 2-reductase
MENAFGEPQTVVLFGGTSEIGLAIVHAMLSPATRTVVLACRDVERGAKAATGLRSDTLDVDVVHFDATARESHDEVVRTIAARHGDLDVAIIAFALLGDGEITTTDSLAAAQLADVNFTGTVSATVAVASRMRQQGHGSIVMLSSVAGERVRRANPVYGGTKAGIDGFAQGLGDMIAADGVHMLIVRPGFVHTRMTAGRPAAPMSTTADAVAAATVKALGAKRRIVWVPSKLRYVFMILRHLPAPIWRRLPLG